MGCLLCCQPGGNNETEPTNRGDERPLVEQKKLRALCLHGKGANADVMQIQLHNLGLGEVVEIITETGTVPGPAFDGSSQTGFFDWYDDDKSPREAAKELLEKVVKKHLPIDLVIGFSQGAAMATILIHGVESMDKSLTKSLPKYIISINGTCNDAISAAAESSADSGKPRQFPITAPSLHIQGRADPFYADSIDVQNRFANPTIIPHQHGHEVTKDIGSQVKPAVIEWLQLLA
eukprot:TRINITY_DN11921_c0_g1_i1.p1 TRINITY_DN11921_c0_g1~~TRINITY_DN11921_c0_g1_i1.p1  ORF type:complete len:234 (+),score=42.51 TRINITY_DN11921_c0_g1_i1:41-742(+)